MIILGFILVAVGVYLHSQETSQNFFLNFGKALVGIFGLTMGISTAVIFLSQIHPLTTIPLTVVLSGIATSYFLWHFFRTA